MAVGAIIGLTLGPKSGFLEHDSYQEKAKQVTLLTNKDDPESAITLPPKFELDLRIKEVLTKELTDKNGKIHKVPSFVRVSFKFDKKMSLSDKSGALKKALGNPKVDEKVEAWLVPESRLLNNEEEDEGEVDVLVLPVPVSGLGTTIIAVLSPLGEIFMALIKMVIVPLVFASLLVGVAGLGDVRKLGRLGARTLGLYLLTTGGAVTIGLLAAHAIQPGNFVAEKERAALVASFEGEAEGKMDQAAESKGAVDNLIAIIPKNPVESLSSGNMLQIIFFAFIFGIALTILDEKRSQQVITFMDTIQHAMILIIHMVMALAPYGVAALLAEVVGQSGISILAALVVYALTVVVGLACLTIFVYGGLVRAFVKLPFVQFLRAARPAQLIAFSTSSSSATLPITLECAEENLGISKSVSSFVIPLGSTVNMDGTALYQGVAAIFIAQVFGVELSIGDQLGIVFAATAASIGAAGVPGAGMITLAMVLLDMFRTAVNVTGDLAVTAVMAVSEGEKIQLLSDEEDERDKTRGFEGRTDRKPEKILPEGHAEKDE
jgi:Na+/H+-dicarboxylate symporter